MTIQIDPMDECGKEFLTSLFQSSVHGQCYPFAIALHRGLGWPMIGMVDENSRIIHAGVKSPEGKIWDGRGEISNKQFIQPFEPFTTSFVIRHITEQELLTATTRRVLEWAIKIMQKKAQTLWPHLPWKQETFQDRVIAFANDLEVISKKYRLWICSNGSLPSALPVIFEGHDDEDGYTIKPTADGSAFTINIRL